MSGTIYVHELKMKLKSVIIWSLSITGIMLLYFSIYPSFADQTELLQEMMSQFPPEFLAAFGMNGLDFTSVMGFYALTFLFVQLCVAVQAANYGFGLVSVEERELTADFLLSKPVSRLQVMTSKMLAALTAILFTNLVAWAASFGFVNLFRGDREYDPVILVKLLAGLFIFQLFFLMVGVFISLLVRRVRSVTPYSMALAFGMYVLSAFSDMLGDVAIEKITPFKHFNANYLVSNGEYDVGLVMISVVVIVIAFVGSYWLYIRRDIPAVT